MRKARPLTEIEKDALVQRLNNIGLDWCGKVPRHNTWSGDRYMFRWGEMQKLMSEVALTTAEFLLEIRREKGEVE